MRIMTKSSSCCLDQCIDTAVCIIGRRCIYLYMICMYIILCINTLMYMCIYKFPFCQVREFHAEQQRRVAGWRRREEERLALLRGEMEEQARRDKER